MPEVQEPLLEPASEGVGGSYSRCRRIGGRRGSDSGGREGGEQGPEFGQNGFFLRYDTAVSYPLESRANVMDSRENSVRIVPVTA